MLLQEFINNEIFFIHKKLSKIKFTEHLLMELNVCHTLLLIISKSPF